MRTRPARIIPGAVLGLLALSGGGCSDDDSVAPISSAGYQRVYYWSNVLRKYPDLPRKVDAIIRDGERGRLGGRSSPDDRLPGARIVVHDGPESYTFDARTIDVIVMDMSLTELKALREEWRGVESKAAKLGIVPTATPASHRADRVIVLGSKGAIEVKGPDGSSKHSVSALHAQDTGHVFLTVHAFGTPGENTLGRLLDAYDPHSPRGPPDLMGGTRSPRPPPGGLSPSALMSSSLSSSEVSDATGLEPGRKLTIVVIGEVDSYRIRGPSDFSQQTVNFCSFLNSHEYDFTRDHSETREATHFATAASEHYREYVRSGSYREPGTTSSERPSEYGGSRPSEHASYPRSERPFVPREAPIFRPSPIRIRPGR